MISWDAKHVPMCPPSAVVSKYVAQQCSFVKKFPHHTSFNESHKSLPSPRAGHLPLNPRDRGYSVFNNTLDSHESLRFLHIRLRTQFLDVL